MANIRKEFKEVLLEPYLKENPEKRNSKMSINEVLDFETIFNLKYYSNCFLESLRIEPPVMYSSHCCMT